MSATEYENRILTETYHSYLKKYEHINNYLKTPSARSQFRRRVNERCNSAMRELQQISTKLPYEYRRKTFFKPEFVEFVQSVLDAKTDGNEKSIIKDKLLFQTAVKIAITALNCAYGLIDADFRLAVEGVSLNLLPEREVQLIRSLSVSPALVDALSSKKYTKEI